LFPAFPYRRDPSLCDAAGSGRLWPSDESGLKVFLSVRQRSASTESSFSEQEISPLKKASRSF
jgi:hypothetical protein